MIIEFLIFLVLLLIAMAILFPGFTRFCVLTILVTAVLSYWHVI